MTQGEKEQFFALYWGQDVGCVNQDHPDSNSPAINMTVDHECHEYDYLLLKPLLFITDEDAIELGYKELKGSLWGEPQDQTPSMVFCTELNCQGTDFDFPESMNYPLVDKLRAMGYAIGWKDYSVEDLIKEGLINLQK